MTKELCPETPVNSAITELQRLEGNATGHKLPSTVSGRAVHLEANKAAVYEYKVLMSAEKLQQQKVSCN